jgi:hypothetical protein
MACQVSGQQPANRRRQSPYPAFATSESGHDQPIEAGPHQPRLDHEGSAYSSCRPEANCITGPLQWTAASSSVATRNFGR